MFSSVRNSEISQCREYRAIDGSSSQVQIVQTPSFLLSAVSAMVDGVTTPADSGPATNRVGYILVFGSRHRSIGS